MVLSGKHQSYNDCATIRWMKMDMIKCFIVENSMFLKMQDSIVYCYDHIK